MIRQVSFRLILVLCLCGAGAWGWIPARADPGASPKPARDLMADNPQAADAAAPAATAQPDPGRELGAGMASWYGSHFHGRRTASGEKFDRYALTAAHKTLPLGTRVMVSSPRTGRQIVVRINDRGPYVGNRILDLSEAAASALGLKARGRDWVVLRAVAPSLDSFDAVAYSMGKTLVGNNHVTDVTPSAPPVPAAMPDSQRAAIGPAV
jgi:rare lipoprotein A